MTDSSLSTAPKHSIFEIHSNDKSGVEGLKREKTRLICERQILRRKLGKSGILVNQFFFLDEARQS